MIPLLDLDFYNGESKYWFAIFKEDLPSKGMSMKKWTGVFWKVCVSLEANLKIGYGLSGSSFQHLTSAPSIHLDLFSGK